VVPRNLLVARLHAGLVKPAVIRYSDRVKSNPFRFNLS
jgi:hypothetical protein